MERFAFIIHPIDAKRDAARKYPVARLLPTRAVEAALKLKKPEVISHITGVRSRTGAEAEGWFIGLPLSPRQFLKLDTEFVYGRIVECGQIAEQLGAKIIGLGAYTSVVGDAGVTVAQRLNLAVTSGNSYTVYTALEGLFEAARRLGIEPRNAITAIIGATGATGKVCAKMLAGQVAKLILIGRNADKLNAVRDELARPDDVAISTDPHTALTEADLVVAVSSAVEAIVQPRDLKTGCIVCDVARPRDVSVQVAKQRDDVLIIEGGVVEVPGDVDFGFHFGFPPRTAYACMSETMMCALEGTYPSYTLGRDLTVEQVEGTGALARKHGFKLAGFRSFERPVSDEDFERVRSTSHQSPVTSNQ